MSVIKSVFEVFACFMLVGLTILGGFFIFWVINKMFED